MQIYDVVANHRKTPAQELNFQVEAGSYKQAWQEARKKARLGTCAPGAEPGIFTVKRVTASRASRQKLAFAGKATTAGNSRALTFEAALFRAHPEFTNGPVAAQVIAPGRLLVTALDVQERSRAENDPVLHAYLAFLERDLVENPQRLAPLTEASVQRAADLVSGIPVDLDREIE